MNAAAPSASPASRPSQAIGPRAFRFSLLSLALLALLLVAGWAFFSGVVQWSVPSSDWQSAIEVDGETIHIGGGDPLHWLVAGIGLVIAFVVVVLVVPVVVVLALAVPALLVVTLLAVPLNDETGTVGVLEALDKNGGTFSLRDLDIATAMGGIIRVERMKNSQSSSPGILNRENP